MSTLEKEARAAVWSMVGTGLGILLTYITIVLAGSIACSAVVMGLGLAWHMVRWSWQWAF